MRVGERSLALVADHCMQVLPGTVFVRPSAELLSEGYGLRNGVLISHLGSG